MKSDRANVYKVEGYPGAVVWEVKDEPGIFYLTNSRGKNKSTQQLEARDVKTALKEAKDWVS